jgi:pimeloyl-ACP methyl ester carboxylesterase
LTEIDRARAELARLAGAADRHDIVGPLGRIVWRTWGAGPPLVLLHGAYGSWRHWARTLPLAATHRLLVPDLPGFGSSGPVAPGIELPTYAAAVTESLKAIVGASAALRIAGFSFGARVAGLVAAGWGRPVDRLHLIAPGGLPFAVPPLPPLRPCAQDVDEESRLAVHRYNLGALMLADPSRADPLAVLIQDLNVREARFRPRLRGEDRILHGVLAAFMPQVVAVWGDRDPYVADTLQDRIAYVEATAHRASTHVIAGAGHWLPYERPEEINRLLAT